MKKRFWQRIGGMVLILFFGGLAWIRPVWAFDHQYTAWNNVLRTHVRAGLVHYAAIKRSPQGLRAAIQALEAVTAREYDQWSRSQKMAFWINAYNIGAIRLVVTHYPIKRAFGVAALRYPANSIQQIPDVWKRPVMRLLGRPVSLDFIENAVLRKEFGDPRAHFAIVCASLGCPVIRKEAYQPDRLEEQLRQQIAVFVRTPSKFRYDGQRDVLFLSPIFKWFKEDFDKKGGAVAFLKTVAPAGTVAGLSDKTRIEWQAYDWRLNEYLP